MYKDVKRGGKRRNELGRDAEVKKKEEEEETNLFQRRREKR